MKEIADVLMVSIQTVSNHIADYKKLDKLKPERGGSEEKLSKEQSEHLETHLQENIYLHVKVCVQWVVYRTGDVICG